LILRIRVAAFELGRRYTRPIPHSLILLSRVL
jgi:hypothetical protein